MKVDDYVHQDADQIIGAIAHRLRPKSGPITPRPLGQTQLRRSQHPQRHPKAGQGALLGSSKSRRTLDARRVVDGVCFSVELGEIVGLRAEMVLGRPPASDGQHAGSRRG